MRVARILLPCLAALVATGCARPQPARVADYEYTARGGGQAPDGAFRASQGHARVEDTRALYASPQAAQQEYAEPFASVEVQQQYESGTRRGLFNASHAYARQRQGSVPQQSYVVQYQPEPQPEPQYAAGGPYLESPYVEARASASAQPPYTLDAGDKLRVVVFGQEGISGTYTVDAGGNISMPLIGTVPARGVGTQHLARTITQRLKQGYVREPHVTVTIETYRPFFILGEVTTPGQYPYVPNMTVETAIAVAGGFAPRAQKKTVKLSRTAIGQQFSADVPLNYPVRPGDTIMVNERWF